MATSKKDRDAELYQLAAELEGVLAQFRVLGDRAPNAKETKLLLNHYAEKHPRPAWKQATHALAAAAWLFVLGVNSAKDTRRIATVARGDKPPQADDESLEIAAGKRQRLKAAMRGRQASEELRAKLVYNLLAEGCSKCLQPDTNRGMRGPLGTFVLAVRDSIKQSLRELPKRDRQSSSR